MYQQSLKEVGDHYPDHCPHHCHCNVLTDNGNGADSDPDSGPQPLSVTADTLTTINGGNVAIAVDGSFTYTPATSFVGQDSFDYTLSDGEDSDTGTVTITVNSGGNQSPVAVNDVFVTLEDIEVSGNVLTDNGNGADSDPDSGPQPLSVTADTLTTINGGNVAIAVDGSFTYTPATSFVGQDSFDYTLSDGEDSDTGTVTITVNSGDGIPVVAGLVLHLESDQNVTGTGSNVDGWLDQSGFGNDLAGLGDPQLVAGATPTGMAAISLDGVGDVLQAADQLNNFPGGSSDRTMFFVADYKGNDNNLFFGASYGNGANNQAFGLIIDNNENLAVQGWGGGNDIRPSTPERMSLPPPHP